MRRAPAGAVVVHGFGLIGFPVFHRERVGHDARARLHVEDLRPQLHVDRRQQEHGDDVGLREVAFEEVGLGERRLAGDARPPWRWLDERDHVGVVFDAERPSRLAWPR